MTSSTHRHLICHMIIFWLIIVQWLMIYNRLGDKWLEYLQNVGYNTLTMHCIAIACNWFASPGIPQWQPTSLPFYKLFILLIGPPRSNRGQRTSDEPGSVEPATTGIPQLEAMTLDVHIHRTAKQALLKQALIGSFLIWCFYFKATEMLQVSHLSSEKDTVWRYSRHIECY